MRHVVAVPQSGEGERSDRQVRERHAHVETPAHARLVLPHQILRQLGQVSVTFTRKCKLISEE